MGHGHPDGNRLMRCTSLETSMFWPTFCEPDPRIASFGGSDSEASANPRGTPNTRAVPVNGSGTRSIKRGKEYRLLQENNVLVCSPVCPSPKCHPEDRSVVLCPTAAARSIGNRWPSLWLSSPSR